MLVTLNKSQKEVYLSIIEDEVIYTLLEKALDKVWTLEDKKSDYDGWYDYILYVPSIPYEDAITEDFAIDILKGGK